MMKYIFLMMIMNVALIGIAGCCSCRHTENAIEQKSIQPFQIKYEAGGGFSGHHAGYIFSSDGLISRISWFPRQEQKSEPVDSSHKAEIFEIKKLIDQLELSKLSIKEAGNMTTTLTVIDGDSSYYLSWDGVSTDKGNVPKQVLPVVEKILALTELIEKSNSNSK